MLVEKEEKEDYGEEVEDDGESRGKSMPHELVPTKKFQAIGEGNVHFGCSVLRKFAMKHETYSSPRVACRLAEKSVDYLVGFRMALGSTDVTSLELVIEAAVNDVEFRNRFTKLSLEQFAQRHRGDRGQLGHCRVRNGGEHAVLPAIDIARGRGRVAQLPLRYNGHGSLNNARTFAVFLGKSRTRTPRSRRCSPTRRTHQAPPSKLPEASFTR